MKLRFNVAELEEHKKKLQQVKSKINTLMRTKLNKITERHLARVIENTDVGDSPDSPTLRNTWDRSAVVKISDGYRSEVFNNTDYASYYEYGHRQQVGRLVFIELLPGARKYGYTAKQQKNGKWGIFLRLKNPVVKGRYVMTNSEKKAQTELDKAMQEINKALEDLLK